MQKKQMLLRITCALITIMLGLNAISPISLANEDTGFRNLAAGLSYNISTNPRDTWPDTGGKELTDGKYASKKYTDSAWQGHHINDETSKTRSVVFDLEEPKSIKKISANFLHDPNTGIRFPLKTTIEVSNDNQQWHELSEVLSKKSLGYEYIATQPFFWDGDKDGVPAQKTMNMVYAQYVRISFILDSPWVFIDEVEIIGTDGKAESAWEVPTQESTSNSENTTIQEISTLNEEPSETGIRNLVSGMDYEISIDAHKNYPDSGKELTDGIYGTKSYYNKAWQGHNKSAGEERAVIFDLGEPKSIKRISANFLHYPSAGMKYPSRTIVEVSNDKENWGELAEILTKKSLDYEYPAIQEYYWDGAEDGVPTLPIDVNMVYAQYVRIRFSIDAPWVFIDEIEIWGTDGKLPGAEILPPSEDDPAQGLPEGADYMRCGETTGNINNLVLLYNHVNRVWTKDDILPYLAYVDKKGEIKDSFFDGVLYLGLKTPDGKTFDTTTKNPSSMKDWEWYLDRTFKENGDMAELNNAAKEVAEALGEPNRKIKVFLMIPYPSPAQSKFGDIDGSGTVLNFNHEEIGATDALQNRKKAVKWYTDEAKEQWNANSYSNLELTGFYWLGETISDGTANDPELVTYASNLVHGYNLKHLWIPYFKAAGRSKWQEFGFDMAVIQPNYYFDKYAKDTRLRDASIFARKYNMGIEMEFDERIKKDDDEGKTFRTKYKRYLDDGVQYGYTGNVFKAYYQGGTGLLECAKSDVKEIRDIYYNTYKFVRNQYPPEGEEEEPEYKGIVIDACTFTNILGKDELTVLQPGSTVMANITVRNDDTKGNSVVIVTALYDKDAKMERIALVEKTLTAGETETLKAGFDLPDTIDGHCVKVFVWDNLDNMNPISNVITFPQQ